ncbi:MAG TPA: ABC transporter ATP-binding protein [Actinomycetota bacterium]|nr:ABC transporter ATP-binding protein [Actinomycetota bacterium]
MTAFEAELELRRDGFEVRASFDAPKARTVAFVGPNGAGKSTLVHAVAGLLPIDRGRVCAAGIVWEDTSAGVRLRPQDRSLGMVFQDVLLFPSLSVLDNVAYGLRARGVRRRQAGRTALEWLRRLDAGHLAARPPGSLSGGEAQRVAVARALAVEPEVLVLDEPTSALDVEARAATRRLLRTVLGQFAGVKLLVTHDPIEATTMADELIVVEGGRVTQRGTPAEIRDRPRSRYSASLVGLNLLRGRMTVRDGHHFLQTSSGELHVAAAQVPSGAETFAVVHPSAVALAVQPDRPSGSIRNALPARIADYHLEGDRVRVHLASRPPLTAEITLEALQELGLHHNQEVWALIKATQIEVYPA